MSPSLRRLVAAASILAFTGSAALAATPSTATGQISVAQVMSMLEQANSNATAAQVLQAYLGGLGEAAGVLISATDSAGRPYVSCERAMALDAATVRKTLTKAVPDNSDWAQTAATPLIVSALVTRAGCR